MCADADLGFHGDAEIAGDHGTLVDLAVNVRPAAPPGWLAERLSAALTSIASYPDARGARGAAAARHCRHPDEVLLTAGAAEAFTLIARAFSPQCAVVVHPQFTEPEAALRAAGHAVRRVILPPDFALPARAVPAEADLVIVGNPTNPTSVLHPAALIASLARAGRVLVVDEAFADCVPGEPESLAARRDVPGLVVIRSLTKTWGLAGLRVGYILASAAAVKEIGRMQPPWAVSTPALAAVEACTSSQASAEADSWAREMGAARDALAAALGALPGVRVVPGAQASFLLLRAVPPAGSAASYPEATGVRRRLRERGFAVRRGETFPGLGPGWLRVAVRDRSTNEAFTAALADVMKGAT